MEDQDCLASGPCHNGPYWEKKKKQMIGYFSHQVSPMKFKSQVNLFYTAS